MENLVIVAFTHKQLYINDLGKLVVEKEQLVQCLTAAQANPLLCIEEIFYISTCNRVEFVFTTGIAEFNTHHISELLGTFYPAFSPTRLSNYTQQAEYFTGNEAINHLFKVVSSIESMVIGEREIAKQVREAYDLCCQLGFTGDYLRLLIKQTIKLSKEVFTFTKIAERPISVASLAARKLIESTSNMSARIAVVGAGETNALVTKYLHKKGFNNFTIFNRTLERAETLAHDLKGKAMPLTAVYESLSDFDVLISCTSATAPLFNLNTWTKQAPTTVIDLAVPNDFDQALVEQNTFHYISVSSLKSEVDQNIQLRNKEVEKVHELIANNISELKGIIEIRNVELALSDFPDKIKAIRKKALNEVFAKEIANLDDDTKALLDKMLFYMEKKCISVPIVIAKQKLLKGKSKQFIKEPINWQ